MCYNGSLVTYFYILGIGSDIAFRFQPCELLHCGGCWGSKLLWQLAERPLRLLACGEAQEQLEAAR